MTPCRSSFDAEHTIDEDNETSEVKRVVETLSSYEDLNFLWSKLNRLNRRCFSKRWTVFVPHDTEWTHERRAAFAAWAKTLLGFTVDSPDMGTTEFKISKARGAKVLNTLAKCITFIHNRSTPCGDLATNKVLNYVAAYVYRLETSYSNDLCFDCSPFVLLRSCNRPAATAAAEACPRQNVFFDRLPPMRVMRTSRFQRSMEALLQYLQVL